MELTFEEARQLRMAVCQRLEARREAHKKTTELLEKYPADWVYFEKTAEREKEEVAVLESLYDKVRYFF